MKHIHGIQAIAIVVVMAVAIALSALAGCGAGSEQQATAQVLSRAEFIYRASAICRRERAALPGEMAQFLELQPSGKPPLKIYTDLAHFVLLPMVEDEIVRLEALKPPSADAKRVAAMILAEHQAVDRVATTSRIASVEAVRRQFAGSARLFRSYGLSACANGPART